MESVNETKVLSYSYIGSLMLKYWYLIIISLSACFGLAYQELLKELPSYQISGTVLIEEDKSAGAIEGGIQGVTLKVGNTLGNEIQMLKSRNMMEDVVRELALEVSYISIGEYKNTDLYYDTPVRLNFTDNIESLAWKNIEIEILDTTSYVMIFDGQKPVNQVFGDPFELNGIPFVLNRTERPINDEYQNVRIAQEVPQKGIDIINKLVEIFFRKSLDEKKKQASNTLMFIEERLKYVTDELFNVEKSIENYRINNDIKINLADNAATYVTKIAATDEAILGLEIKKNDLTDFYCLVLVSNLQRLRI